MTILRPVPPLRFLTLALVVATAAACDSGPAEPSNLLPTAPFSRTDVRVGTGAEATGGTRVTVHYTGWLYDPFQAEQKGREFDSSVGRTPFSFVLGAGAVIAGWDQGLPGMRVGGMRRLIIPPTLAYGAAGAGNGIIPPNATLLFEVELLDVQ